MYSTLASRSLTASTKNRSISHSRPGAVWPVTVMRQRVVSPLVGVGDFERSREHGFAFWNGADDSFDGISSLFFVADKHVDSSSAHTFWCDVDARNVLVVDPDDFAVEGAN